ncbi:hypothetical protein [Pseudomonas sp. IT-P100]|uniref:hypothetical protein n=1 Tax=Pseudomonas sp. IT-P100 TaxID=3026452 RepID=UPI0039E0F8CE
MRILIGVFALAVLTGCSTSPLSSENAKAVPVERLLQYQEKSAKNDATVVVTRDSGLMMGGGCHLGFFVDGKLSARLSPGETAKFYVPSGERLLGMGSDPKGNGLCAISSVALREVNATLTPGVVKRFRILGDQTGGFTITPTSY